MSRSRKKSPIITDVGAGNKKYSHRVVRTQVRKVLTSNKTYDEMLFPTAKAKELVNQYDICDHIWRLDLSTRYYFNYYTGKKMSVKVTKQDILKYYRK